MKVEARWRWIVAADIIMHLTAVWWFALLPPNTLNLWEKIVMGLATLAGVGVVTHASPRLNIPGDHWSYLAAGFVCIFTLLVYESRVFGLVPASTSVPFGLFLTSGAVSSFAAHVVDGGPLRKVDRGR